MRNKDIFTHARLKLTIFYTLILGVILLVFSTALIFTIESKVRRGLRDHIVVTDNRILVENDPLERASDDIEMFIYIIDALLLVGVGAGSYFLAGKTLEPIKKALDAQKKFSADASHDLRTPLAIITTESEVTLKNKNSTKEELAFALTSNLEEAKKMSRLVDDLLIISREDTGSYTKQSLETTDIYHFVKSITDRFAQQAKEKNTELTMGPYMETFSLIDSHTLNRALSNVIHNAVKYTDTGTITVTLKNEAKNIHILVADTGCGIKKEDLPYVFDRFYKAEHSRSDTGSSGLGLSIAKQIIEQHKGTITITGEQGKGTVVQITLPKV